MSNSTQNDWEKRYDEFITFVTNEKNWIDGRPVWKEYKYVTLANAIKYFIRKELADARREVIEKIEKIPHKEIIIETKGGQVNCHDCKMLPKSPFCRHAQGWNDACRHILATLREEEGNV